MHVCLFSWVLVWDYHVIVLLALPDSPPLIYDLDSTLPFPTPGPLFTADVLRDPSRYRLPEIPRRFRVVSYPHFRARFASDRRHMKQYLHPDHDPTTRTRAGMDLDMM